MDKEMQEITKLMEETALEINKATKKILLETASKVCKKYGHADGYEMFLYLFEDNPAYDNEVEAVLYGKQQYTPEQEEPDEYSEEELGDDDYDY